MIQMLACVRRRFGAENWAERRSNDVKTVGNARRIDQLGRIVIPAELRRVLGIRQGDLLDIRAEDDRLVLTKLTPECAICGRSDELVGMHEKHVCKDCVRDISLV
jgi:transcriptional pleiotropic regulator of transition state genes